MALTQIQEAALKRWHELGNTTPAHPVLQMAYDLYLAPMGVVADALRYDALAALEDRTKVAVELVAPRWEAAKVDRSWNQFAVIEPLTKLEGILAPEFGADGTLEGFEILNQGDEAAQAAIAEFETKHADEIFGLSEVVMRAVKLYIDAALESMLQEKKESQELAQMFVDNPRRYAAEIFQLFTTPLPKG